MQGCVLHGSKFLKFSKINSKLILKIYEKRDDGFHGQIEIKRKKKRGRRNKKEIRKKRWIGKWGVKNDNEGKGKLFGSKE